MTGETGETGPVSVPLAVSLTITALFGMACLNCAEILIIALYTFKRYTSLYFWSIIVADLGTVIYAMANLLRLFALAPNILMSVLLAISWWGMVTAHNEPWSSPSGSSHQTKGRKSPRPVVDGKTNPTTPEGESSPRAGGR
ncbi:integral membrane protein [Ilyonectria robusta]